MVERLRWLELGRPHRSLDAVIAIVVEYARRLGCRELLVRKLSAVEQGARRALDERAVTAGFAALPDGWHHRL